MTLRTLRGRAPIIISPPKLLTATNEAWEIEDSYHNPLRILLYEPVDRKGVLDISCRSSTRIHSIMASLPFRDINVHASASHYAFTSPSSPTAPTLVVDRPSGDLRLNDGALLGGKRVSSIAGILGIIKLRLGKKSS